MAVSDAERFAGLIDAPTLEHSGDPELSDSAARFGPAPSGETGQLVALVSALREMDFDVGPSEQTRWRQRRRLVAMAAVREIPDEAGAGRHRAFDAAKGADRSGAWYTVMARIRQAQSGRRLIAAVAGLSVIVAALGVMSLLAQSAIPGDSLYAVKRGTEQARLVLAGDEQSQGRVLLGFATTRLGELGSLLDEPVSFSATGSGVQAADSGDVSELLVTTMETMDRQTTDGTSALTSAAVDDSEAKILSFVGVWGVEQFETLNNLASRMPEEAKARAELSKDLLQEVVERLDELVPFIDCDCLGDAPGMDALGPIPCSDCDSDASAAPSQSSSSPGQSDPAPSQSAPPTSTTIPGQSPAPPGVPGDPGGPIPTEDPTEDPTVDPTADPTADPTLDPTVDPPIPPIPPLPPAEGSACVTVGGLPGIIQGGVCIALPIDPPPDPNEGQPCILVDLPWPLDDILGIIVDGICVIG